LIFHSLTLHRALPNVTADRLRVSLDNRYQALSSPIAEHQMQPHLSGFSSLTWEEVYAGWKSQEMQYYWKDPAMTVVPRDMSYLERGFNEALSLAKQGDRRARLHLTRAIERDRHSEQAKVATEALRQIGAG
jgi:hypothetical protein